MKFLMQKVDTIPTMERWVLGRLCYKIADVLGIKDDDVTCTIEFFERENIFREEGQFSLADTDPYRIRLANQIDQPFRRRQLDRMGRCLAHEMIHLKQALRDGLTVKLDEGGRRGYVSYKGEHFHVDMETLKRDPALKRMPFEREAYDHMDEVYDKAVAKLTESEVS